MIRLFTNQFESWLQDSRRKPLILQGARQVGKTYFIENLKLENKGKVHKLDFIEDKSSALLFESEINKPQQLLLKLERHLSNQISIEKDLIFFDEIQACPAALQSLKYFAQKLPKLKIVAAGSFLGLMSQETSFPVGYVDFLSMAPLSFFEFLISHDHDLADVYKSLDPYLDEPIDPYYHKQFLMAFQLYQALGGMPEVLNVFFESKANYNLALDKARKVQKNLLQGYQADFAKHSGVINAGHIIHVFNAIPAQLAQYQDNTVGKFKFSHVIPKNSGFGRIAGPLEWLEKARLVIRVNPSNKAEEPLLAHTKPNVFKLYLLDVGLLHASLSTPMESIIDKAIGSYKGFIVENFVATELNAKFFEPLNSWAEGQAEIEFLIHKGKNIVPIEVKSSANFLRSKSLDSYITKYQPKMAIKLAPLNRGYNKQKRLYTVPIYLAGKI